MKSGVQKILNINRIVVFLFVLSAMAFSQSSVDSLELYDPYRQSDHIRRIIDTEFSVLGREYSDSIISFSEIVQRAAEDDYRTKGDAYIRIGDIYFRFSNYAKSLDYYFQALKQFAAGGDSLTAAFVKLKLGRAYYFADIAPAADYFRDAGTVLKNAPRGKFLAYYYYILWTDETSPAQRNDHLKKAIILQEELVRENKGNKDLLTSLATFYNAAGRLEEAISAAEQAGDSWLEVLLLNNLGFRLAVEGKYQQALALFNKSLTLSREGRFKTLLRNGYENTSRVYRLMGEHQKAGRYMQIMILIMESLYKDQIRNQIGEIRVKYESEQKDLENRFLKKEQERLSAIAEAEGNLNKLLAVLTLLIASAFALVYIGNRKLKKMNLRLDMQNTEIMQRQEELTELNRILSDSEKNLKDAQATAHLANWEMDPVSKNVICSDQFPVIFRSAAVEPGTDAFEKIMRTLCPKEDALRLRKFLDTGEEVLNIREMEFRIVSESTLQWIRIKKFVRKNSAGEVIKLYGTVQDITEQKIEEENKIKIAEQNAYTRELIKYQEEERKKIAGELHDGLGQDLLLIKNRALLALQNQQLDTEAANQISEISTTASAVLDTLRAISFDLRPVHIERIGLAEVLKSTVERLRQISQKNMVCDVDDISGLFSVESEVNLFRIYQEALSNIIKYSEAMDVYVGLHKKEDTIHILVRDNGKGFDYDRTLKESAGFGLRSIMNRAEFVRGKIQIITSPGSGTVIDISIPFEAK